MSTTPTHPGVYIQELPSAVHRITGRATSIGAFVGYTARGIDNRAEQIFGFYNYERLFGGLASDSELRYAVQQFFDHGGTEAYVVRVPRTGAQSAAILFDSLTFTALGRGSWANGELLIDGDTNGLTVALPDTVEVTHGSPTVTGVDAAFTRTLKSNQWLVLASDPTQTPDQIQSIASDTSISLTANLTGTTQASTTAVIINDLTTFNRTITNPLDDTVESFPNLSLSST